MSVQGLIIVASLYFLISFIYIRGFIYGIKRYQLNNSAYKKRKKDETIKEWLLYSRYKDEIPKFLRIFYYAILLIHLVCIITCVFLYIINLPLNIGVAIVKVMGCFDAAWIVILALLFWSPGREYAYERWITKKRGQKRNKR